MNIFCTPPILHDAAFFDKNERYHTIQASLVLNFCQDFKLFKDLKTIKIFLLDLKFLNSRSF